ncbi:MAG: trypsin-like serine protease [Roseobacter sp.]
MANLGRHPLGALICAAMMCVTASQGATEAFALLNADDRAQWQAVGRVNSAGYARRRGCSGTLIAPDLVVTAAHCVTGIDGANPKQHFIAGWYRGKFTAHRAARDVILHPLYALTQGQARFAYDVALLVLEDPIPMGLLAPIPLHDPSAPESEVAVLLGYENARPHALSGQENCPLEQASDAFRVYACEVRNGASGGAVITRHDARATLSGVIVARQGDGGHAMTVPVSQWLRDRWHQALDRENRRP